MKYQIALVTFVLALSFAQCADVKWTGYYALKSSKDEKTCFPKELYISTVKDYVYYIWVWDNSDSCKQKGLGDGIYVSIAEKPGATVNLKNRVSKDGTDTKIIINGEDITFEASTGADNVYTKTAVETKVGWDGTWVLKETPKSDKECFPKDQVSISTTKTEMKFSWKWDSSDICKTAGLSSNSFDFSLPVIPGNQAMLVVLLPDKTIPFDEWTMVLGLMEVTGDTAKYTSIYTGKELDFDRKIGGGFPTIVIILIIVVVIGVGVGLYLKNKKKEGSGSNTYLKA